MYDAEIEDLLSDSEGKNVLAKRLKEKREQLPELLSMMDCAPEMVTPAFFDAFTFASPARIEDVLRSEPGDRNFPTWASIAPTIQLANWAQPMLSTVLTAPGGDTFMVVSAALEYLRRNGATWTAPVAVPDTNSAPGARRSDDDDANDGDDLAEAGNDWMAEQGFDKLES